MAVEVTKDATISSSLSVFPQMKFAEFFAGIGLMRIGLENQGWSIAYANDIDEKKYEMYKAQFNDIDGHFSLEDVHVVTGEEIPSVALATASFPCNDLSLAGAREGLGGKESSAFWGFINVLKEMGGRKPPLLLVENVTGFLTSHKGEDFRTALIALNEMGYTVDPFILDASHFVPQSRQRLFIVGILGENSEFDRENRGLFQLSTPIESYVSSVRPPALAKFIGEHSEIHWNIRHLPDPPQREMDLQDIVEDLPDEASEWWNTERSEYLLNQMSSRHRAVADLMIQGKDFSYGTVFRRVRKGKSMAELRTDGIAGCLRTPRGGSGRQILFKAGKGKYQVRLLTPRECARLMGVGDFTIEASLNQALFGFGDAVCVPAIEWIAKYYLNPVLNGLVESDSLKID